MPELHIITGSNGAGKSTIGPQFLPIHLKEKYPVFDGDKLFVLKQKELWQSGVKAYKEAKKIAYEFVTDTFDSLIENALRRNDHFVYEGHFTNNATWDIPKKFKQRGYSINMIFLGLTDPELSEFRVLDRTKAGGHYVDRQTIEDNFYGNLEKLNINYTLLDQLQVIDTSEAAHLLIGIFSKGRPIFSIPASQIPHWFSSYLPNLYEKIIPQ